MSADWTAEKLDALPDGTVINAGRTSLAATLFRGGDGWWFIGGGDISSDDLRDWADPGSIRVVSVPIAALLSEGAIRHAKHAAAVDSPAMVSDVLHAAVEHATGGSHE